ncbi:polyketide synthase-like protein [Dothistroma septosporum NZE10]|uniref:Polyketide synthase-like protein n=1 Tax=Dothistroma septosporum (strain NZE10 / CBS 128990) TaxID=675120 RepID=N1PFW7_DOTSN|nr:polyketide synthase-like protein [Dothistroma septosporum NZE10]
MAVGVSAKDGNGHLNGFTNGHSFDKDHVGTHEQTVAICGIGLRLPGGVRSDADLFELLVNKRDARGRVPATRYNVDAYYDPRGRPGSIITEHGYYLDEDLARIDASMFSMSKAEITQMDPGQRLLLEVTREAFEGAGEGDFRGKRIGTFIGDFTQDWEDLQHADLMHSAPYQLTGKADFVLSNRLAYEYDLTGPSVNIKTACSATAEALHQALLSIGAGECYAAIVAGANLIMTPKGSIGMTAMGVLSPDGSCKTFDSSANGFARGESVSAIYIKRLDHALRDGNPVRAVIRACGSNADGGGTGRTFGTPNPVSQEALIRQTYSNAGLDPHDTSVIELHGTGTPIGDPLEALAVANCFADGMKDVYIGSVKPNLGHGEGGSAMASIIKSVLALENRTVLPNIKFNTPNPKIPWERNLKVPTEPLPWPQNACERMSINSFGLGGSNTHIVIDSAASFGISSPTAQPVGYQSGSPRSSLLLMSANSASAIPSMAKGYGKYLQRHPDRVDDMVYTLSERRERLKQASFCIARGSSLTHPAPAAASSRVVRTAFIFTGQGAQWMGMGRELMQEEPVFARSIREMDAIIKTLEQAPEWTLEETMLSDSTSDRSALDHTDQAQPFSTALQVALVDLLATWHIHPAAVVGHSSGEVAAAYTAGILDRREAIITAFYRGYACARNKLPGGMAAVGLGRTRVGPYLKSGVVIACENSNASVTISGDLSALEESMSALREAYPSALVRKLLVPMGYHSHHMATVADLYNELVSPHLEPKSPSVPYFSTVYGRQAHESKVFGPAYWQLNMESPVLFRTAVAKMLAEVGPGTAHLEIGPHSAMSGPLRQIYEETGHSAPYASVLIRNQNASNSFLEAMGKLFVFGLSPRIPAIGTPKVLPDLPFYPWNHETRYWSETRVMADWRFKQHRNHELLGQRALESSGLEPVWRNLLKLSTVPWLADHRIGSDVVFPAAAYIAMAGAAVSQLDDHEQQYTVREVHIASALVLQESTYTEVITTLRKQSLTTHLNSKWYEFTIASENNGTWTKHCHGLVAAGVASDALPSSNSPQSHQKLSRKVDTGRWYTAMTRIGLNYGPRFVKMEDITASPKEQVSHIHITDVQDEHEPYALHPSTIDMVLQSWAVASCHGEYRRLTQLFLPTFIEEFIITPAAGKRMSVKSIASGVAGAALGGSSGMIGGKSVFAMKGFKGTKMDGSFVTKPPEPRTLTLQWHPDLESTDVGELITPVRDLAKESELLERLYMLYALDNWEQIKDITSPHPHLNLYRSWLEDEVERFRRPGQPLVADSTELAHMNTAYRRREIAFLRQRSQHFPMAAAIEVYAHTHAHLLDIIKGSMTLLEILLQNDRLTRFYDYYNDASDPAPFFQLAGLNKPHLRVLEIGAGTGGWTAHALRGLTSDTGERLYDEYTVTDVSTGFLSQCKQRFASHACIKYTLLDITTDPLEQGFKAEDYDMIIASNVLHATPNLVDTLSRCRALLKPDGRLIFQEVCAPGGRYGYIMGLFDGWWLGAEDGRVRSPLISPEEWDRRLTLAGFSGAEHVVFDNEAPYFNFANIIARPAAMQGPEAGRITLLVPNTTLDRFGTLTKEVLETAGYEIDVCAWGANLPIEQDVISLVDVSSASPILSEDHAHSLEVFLGYVEYAVTSAVLWVTRPAQTITSDPRHGMVLGMARTLRSELDMHFATLEVDELNNSAASAVLRVIQRIQKAARDANLYDTEAQLSDIKEDYEYSSTSGELLVPRLHSFFVSEALVEVAPAAESKHLVIGQRGMLHTLHWVGDTFEDLAKDDIEVKMSAVGMNFLDLAVAMNIVDMSQSLGKGYNALGSEGTGVVTKVGANVTEFQIGDRVATMGVDTSVFATTLQRPARLCVRLPTGLSDEDAAAILVPYVTVLWSFIEKARMKKGQTVLIHSAAGGVGIAAIHVARWLGTEIYLTVGGPSKADFLVNQLGVPRERIFNSRNDSFLKDVLAATGGRGVDVVLNSLSGELLHASWQCVAAGGCMLEIGKRDFLGRAKLAMHLFEENRAYFGVDLSRLSQTNPEALKGLLCQTMDLMEQGHLKPLWPTTVFDAEQIESAFRYMQRGVHMGRIVVRMPNNTDALAVAPIVPSPTFKPEATYLLVGGMGGLGRAIIRWMATNGAQDITAVSRSAGSRTGDHAMVAELEELGCTLRCVAADVTDTDAMQRVVESIGDKRIAGVFQMAMVLRDVGTLNLDYDSWRTALHPKVQGTWNLHRLLPQDLDFFVLFGSISGALASYGQANYSAGNCFLDSFVRFRHGLGLAASVVDIAAIGDVGYVAETKDVFERVGRMFGRMATEQEFLDTLQLAVRRSKHETSLAGGVGKNTRFVEPSQIIMHNEMTPRLTDPRNTMPWRRDARIAIYRNMEESGQSTTPQGSERLGLLLVSLSTEPEKLDEPETPLLIAQEIAKRVAAFLMKDEQDDTALDTTVTLADMGADSLVTIEIRNWWKQTFGVEISVLELNSPGTTAESLGRLATQRLKERGPSTG